MWFGIVNCIANVLKEKFIRFILIEYIIIFQGNLLHSDWLIAIGWVPISHRAWNDSLLTFHFNWKLPFSTPFRNVIWLKLSWNEVQGTVPLLHSSLNPIRPGLFSHSPGPVRGGGGSEARIPKLKVNINRLKRNFAWVIIAMKACLMQNLSPVAFLFLEIWRHKIFRGKLVVEFGFLLKEMGLT